jgi:DivIVA domain-containing protein
MALDRQSIERRDFPIARRGYEIDAVDAHLEMVADEYEALRRATGRARESLSGAASEQVRMIVEAAEQTATDLEREAELEARQVRQDAREDAERTRGEAGRQAREHVQRVAESARQMLERIESMERELSGLMDGFRGGAQRVGGDLALLQSTVDDIRGAVAAENRAASDPAPEPGIEAAVAAENRAAAAPTVREDAAPAPKRAERAQAPAEEPAPQPEAERAEFVSDPQPEVKPAPQARAQEELDLADEATTSAGGDDAGARLIALNMALNGSSREETEAYLAEHFDLADPEALLDDVYARAGQ